MVSRNTWIAVAVVVIIIIVGLVGYYWWSLQSQPTKTITLYAGEISASQYGFGSTSTAITSPGPTLNFKVGDVVKVTVNNVGTMPHNWAIVSDKSSATSVVFGAQIDSSGSPIPQGSSGSVTFTVNQAGNFYYICQVPGHVGFGMWGNVVVTT